MQEIIQFFIEKANAFDVEEALTLFAPASVIDDASVGRDGVRQYLDRFFVGYNTRSELLSLEELDGFRSSVRLDFTGDFGHEIGILDITINADGLIQRIDADLE